MGMAVDGRMPLFMSLHPSMPSVSFNLKVDMPFKIDPQAEIWQLIHDAERRFENLGDAAGVSKELEIAVIWNTKEPSRALNPSATVGKHFSPGDTFGIHGEIRDVRPPAPYVPDEEKTPVVILTGFLGSGKTTLLNYILQEQREKKIAVIENEFGEINIDEELLTQDKLAMAEKVVLMDNGCMCCTIRDDLVDGLKSIIAEMEKGNPIDAICIETTGMADPVPIVRTFMSSPEVTERLRLDGIIGVADAKHLQARLDDEVEDGKVNEAFQQVAFADKIILNKLDLVGTEEAVACRDRIRSINAFAKIVPAVRGRIDLSELGNMRAHDLTTFAESSFGAEEPVADVGHGNPDHCEGHDAHEGCHDSHCGHENHSDHGGHGSHEGHGDLGGHGHSHSHSHGESRHDSRVNSFALTRAGDMDSQRLTTWVQSLNFLPRSKGTLFRIKAILAVRGHPYKHVFHRVMDVSDEDDAGLWADGEPRVSKIVFIGKSLDEQFFRKGFAKIFEEDGPAADGGLPAARL